MGNAFTALGGDVGAITINPASSGVLRHSEVSITPGVSISSSTMNYPTGSNISRNSYSDFEMGNAGVVFSFDTRQDKGLLSWNFGLTFNRNNNFYSSSSFNARIGDGSSWVAQTAASMNGQYSFDQVAADDAYEQGIVPWLALMMCDTDLIEPSYNTQNEERFIGSTVNIYNDWIGVETPMNQSYSRYTKGGIDELGINFGGNINDWLYFGINLNFYSLKYKMEERVTESGENPAKFQTGFKSAEYSYYQSDVGSGFGAKFGVIICPINDLRIGLTYTTPTSYSIVEDWEYSMTAQFDRDKDKIMTAHVPGNGQYGISDYRVRVPSRFSVGLAYTFGTFGLVSVDYEGINYANTRLSDINGNNSFFTGANSELNTYYKFGHNIRIGAEINPIQLISLRAGYNYYSKYTSSEIVSFDQHILSAGIGLRITDQFNIDFAWRGNATSQKDDFQLYQDYILFDGEDITITPIGTNSTRKDYALITLKFKF
jgi:hypothetical protein